MSTNPPDDAGTDRSPLDIAEHAFQMLACAPSSLTVDGRKLGHDLPRRRVSLIEVQQLLTAPARSNATHDTVWRMLVTRARQDGPQWLVGAVGVAVPALRGISGGICRCHVADYPHNIDTEVLVAFIEAVRTVNIEPPGLFPRMLATAQRAGERARENAVAAAAWRFALQESALPASPHRHPDLVLLDAVAKGVISELDAELIGMTRLDRRTLGDAAQQLGMTAEAAAERRQHSEPILLEAVLTGEVQAATSLTISPATSWVEEISTTSARSRSSDTQPESTTTNGGWGNPSGSARIPYGPGGWPATFVSHGLVPLSQVPRKRGRHIVRTLAVVAVTVVVVAVFVATVLADSGNAAAVTMPWGGTRAAAPPTGPDDLGRVFTNLRNWIVGLLATLATLMLTIGGLRYLVAGGDPGEVQKAKAAFKAAALGYGLAVLAPLFVNVLKRVVGG